MTKRLTALILSLAMLFSLTACGTQEKAKKTINEQYADIIKQYEEDYGVITKERKIFCRNDALGGVSYIDLIDFNHDSKNELLIIVDKNTKDNDLNGALSCDIYAEKDGKATLVYEKTLASTVLERYNTDRKDLIIDNYHFVGRTLCISEKDSEIRILEPVDDTQIYESKTKDTYNYPTSNCMRPPNYGMVGYRFLKFNGSEFNSEKEISTYDNYCLDDSETYFNGEKCSYETFIGHLNELNKFIECSTFRYEEYIKHNDSVKSQLGLEATKIDNNSENKGATSLTKEEIYKKYKSIVEEYETTYGEIEKFESDETDLSFKKMKGLVYINLIDFDTNGTDELCIVYYDLTKDMSNTDLSDSWKKNHHYILEIYAAQGNEIVKILEYTLQGNDYRLLGGNVLWFGEKDGKTYLGDFIDYFSLNMPDYPEPEDYHYSETDANYRWFTADCYYGYDGEKFVLEEKTSWQGERNEQIFMFNDKIIDEALWFKNRTIEEKRVELTEDNYDEIKKSNEEAKAKLGVK